MAKRFSRRHETSAEHLAAQFAYKSTKSPQARRTRAAERQAARDARSPEEQIALLDSRFGVGLGAVKERARLA